MPAPLNLLKQKLLRRELITGCWLTLASPAVAEALAHCGFDWLLIDTEHGPNDQQNVLAQLQAIDAARANGAKARSIVRMRSLNPALVERVMDCGAQTLMFPCIETAEDAARAVAAVRYQQGNTFGLRGVSSTVRAATYSMDTDYFATANEQACVIALVESAKALANAEAIAATEGIDCVFIGPADFAASMGHLGNSAHKDVQGAVAYVAAVCEQLGKAIGIYAHDVEAAQRYQKLGAHCIGLHADVVWLTRGARAAVNAMKPE